MLRKPKNKTRKSRTRRSRSRRRQTVKRRSKMRGGYGPGAPPYGSPLVTAYPNTWPGAAGHAGQSNYYPLSSNGIPSGLLDPPISTTNTISSASKLMGGGKSMRGGGLLQEITNTTRGLWSNVVHTANSFAGVQPHVSSYPSSTMQPIGLRNIDFVKPSMPPNITTLHNNAGRQVAAF